MYQCDVYIMTSHTCIARTVLCITTPITVDPIEQRYDLLSTMLFSLFTSCFTFTWFLWWRNNYIISTFISTIVWCQSEKIVYYYKWYRKYQWLPHLCTRRWFFITEQRVTSPGNSISHHCTDSTSMIVPLVSYPSAIRDVMIQAVPIIN